MSKEEIRKILINSEPEIDSAGGGMDYFWNGEFLPLEEWETIVDKILDLIESEKKKAVLDVCNRIEKVVSSNVIFKVGLLRQEIDQIKEEYEKQK